MSQSANRFGPLAEGPNNNAGRPRPRDQLSPRSTSESESSAEESDSSDSESTTSELPEAPPPPSRPSPTIVRGLTTTIATFIIDDMGNFESDDEERIDALLPHTIDEYPDSPRGLSLRTEIDQTRMYQHPPLDCSDSEQSDASDSSDDLEADDEFEENLMKRRAERRFRRMTAGSIGKRTITESIGSDSDREDHRSQIPFFLDPSQAGSSARRLRRKVGNRHSLLFHDPPMPRIDQMDEPPTSDDEFHDDDALKQLPYYTLEYITMEVDSP
jgi:hypothetical protein